MYKIIPNSLKPYKLMTFYSINPDNNISNIVALICIKHTDSESLIKIFSLLRATYNFSLTFISLDYDKSQIKALKNLPLV